ncbi:MAG: FAD-dependent oxidoreductase, partial [Proteobacteria bacterium]|nr:FAD-dependent oxidoreductase [Pseudomonadota bacterium]
MPLDDTVDLLVIGGGINGAGIARDAAGRGLSVVLCEQADLASGTSSASSKLIHGGLRYLEHYAFAMV